MHASKPRKKLEKEEQTPVDWRRNLLLNLFFFQTFKEMEMQPNVFFSFYFLIQLHTPHDLKELGCG